MLSSNAVHAVGASKLSVTQWFMGVKIDADDFTRCIYNAVRWLH
jgi:hypothetical protein